MTLDHYTKPMVQKYKLIHLYNDIRVHIIPIIPKTYRITAISNILLRPQIYQHYDLKIYYFFLWVFFIIIPSIVFPFPGKNVRTLPLVVECELLVL